MKFTNEALGLRGLTLSDGSTRWLESGETADLDEKDVAAKADGIVTDDAGPAETAGSEEIADAIALLDADDDDHWTAAGLPAVDAVAELLGKPVSRAAITDAAPDAKRPTE